MTAIKRGKGQRLIPFDEFARTSGSRWNPRIQSLPTKSTNAVGLTVLERVLSRLSDEYLTAENAALFDPIKELLPDQPAGLTGGDRTDSGMTENAVSRHSTDSQRTKRSYERRFAHTVATPGDIEDELRHLITVVGA